jgi:flagellar export protein FliJ
MPFRFALAPLLRLRQSLERQRALRLREASMAVTRTEDTLNRIDQSLTEATRTDESSLKIGRSASELQFALISRANMQRLRQSVHAELIALEIKRQESVQQYRRADREREVLETLGAQQRHTYQQEQRQREQRELDGGHLLQLWRKRGD